MTDTLFSVSQSGATAGRLAITGSVDREMRDAYTISIQVDIGYTLYLLVQDAYYCIDTLEKKGCR